MGEEYVLQFNRKNIVDRLYSDIYNQKAILGLEIFCNNEEQVRFCFNTFMSAIKKYEFYESYKNYLETPKKQDLLYNKELIEGFFKKYEINK